VVDLLQGFEELYLWVRTHLEDSIIRFIGLNSINSQSWIRSLSDLMLVFQSYDLIIFLFWKSFNKYSSRVINWVLNPEWLWSWLNNVEVILIVPHSVFPPFFNDLVQAVHYQLSNVGVSKVYHLNSRGRRGLGSETGTLELISISMRKKLRRIMIGIWAVILRGSVLERSQRLTGRVWVAVNWCSEFLIVISFIELYELSRRILCHFSVSLKQLLVVKLRQVSWRYLWCSQTIMISLGRLIGILRSWNLGDIVPQFP